MSQAVIYCRISKDREGAGLGVERQEEDCRALAAQLGYDVAAVYTDNDLSAYRRSVRKRRTGYDQMLADIRAGKAEAVIAWHTDRLHRSNVELEGYIDACQPNGVPTYTVKAGSLDMATASGRMIARMLGAQARYQSEHMAEQIQRAKQQRVMSGGNAGGPRPFGYEPGGMEVREDEAAEVRRATAAVIEGRTLRSIVKDMNERGVTTSTGGKWTVTKLRAVIMRPRNAGILVFQGREAGEAAWPPLVDELTWRQMRAVLADPARRTSQSNRVNSLGSGLYRCGICGGTLKISTSGAHSKVRGYRCTDYAHLTQAAAPLDEYVIRRLSKVLGDPRSIDAMMKRNGAANGAADAKRIEAAHARLAELGEMFAAGEIDARTLKSATERLRAQIAEIEGSLVDGATPWPKMLVALQWLQKHTEEAWQLWDLDTQRNVLATMATVTVMPARVRGTRFDPDRVVIEWTPDFQKFATPAVMIPVRIAGDPDGTIRYIPAP